jgi:hypothetical protein
MGVHVLLWWPLEWKAGVACQAVLLWLTIGIAGKPHLPMMLPSFCPFS